MKKVSKTDNLTIIEIQTSLIAITFGTTSPDSRRYFISTKFDNHSIDGQ